MLQENSQFLSKLKEKMLFRRPLWAVFFFKPLKYFMNKISFQEFYQELSKQLLGYSSIALITDKSILALYGKALLEYLQTTQSKVFLIVVPEGEAAKSLKTAEICWNKMAEYKMDRKCAVLGMGGGAITDLSGFVAGCYMRGVDVIYIPTTLLGMVDASIGGKTAVNLPTGKNLVGLFNLPKHVFTNTDYLSTLPEREYRAGLAEVIKYGIIQDFDFFIYLEQHVEKILKREPQGLDTIIERSQQIKKAVVERDFKETNLRAILNFGHTFAHALELATNYSKYLHGEAVSIGMCCAVRASIALDLCHFEILERLENLCKAFGLPTELSWNEIGVTSEQFVDLMKRDKKTTDGELTLILVKDLGEAFQHRITPALLHQMIMLCALNTIQRKGAKAQSTQR